MRCREEIAVEGRSRGHVLSRVNECAAQYPSHHHLLKEILATFLRACEYHGWSWRIIAFVIVAHPDAEISQDVFGLTFTEHAVDESLDWRPVALHGFHPSPRTLNHVGGAVR